MDNAENNAPEVDPSPMQEVDDLDDWATKGDAEEKAPAERPRQANGKFQKVDSSYLEADKLLRETKKAIDKDDNNLRRESGRKPNKREARYEAEEETEVEEEVGEPEPKPKTSRKVKAIVNGAEEVIDLDDEEYQKINSVQAMRASQKAFREAAQMRKETNELRQTLENARANVKQDPMKLFKALGIDEQDVYNFAQNMTINKLSETIDPHTGQPYTPEQQRIIQLQNQLKGKEQIEQETKQKQEAYEFEQMKEVVRQDIDRKFTSALQETGLPTTQYTMMRLADLMESLGPDVDPATVAPMVVEDIITEFTSVTNGFPIEVVAEILGEKFLNKLRKWDIDKARSGREKFGRNPRNIPANRDERGPSRSDSKGRPSLEEAGEWLEKWAQPRR